MIYPRTRNLRAVQLLLWHSKLERTVRHPGIDVDDALEIAEQADVWVFVQEGPAGACGKGHLSATTGRTGGRKIASPPTGLRGTADAGRCPFAGSKSRKRPLDACRRQRPADRPLLRTSSGHCPPVPALRPCAVNDSNAAVAAGGSQTSNSRSRTHCSHSGALRSRHQRPVSGVLLTLLATVGRREAHPVRSTPNIVRARPNDCSPSARQVAADPLRSIAPFTPRPQSRPSRARSAPDQQAHRSGARCAIEGASRSRCTNNT